MIKKPNKITESKTNIKKNYFSNKIFNLKKFIKTIKILKFQIKILKAKCYTVN